jgi:hypothetical protein
VELILLFVIVFFVSGGGSWLVRRYFGARHFLADHYGTYRLAAAASVLTGLAVVLDSYLLRRELGFWPAATVGSLFTFVLLPAWFASLLAAGLLYRILIAPTLEVAGSVVAAGGHVVIFGRHNPGGWKAFLVRERHRAALPFQDCPSRPSGRRRAPSLPALRLGRQG